MWRLQQKRGLISFRAYDLKRTPLDFRRRPQAPPIRMNLATVDSLPAPFEFGRGRFLADRSRRRLGRACRVAILSGWFVVTRLGFRHDLRVWDVIALRFGEGAVFLTPALIVGPLRLRLRAWPRGIVLAALWGAPFILLVGMGLQATSATLTSSVTPALMPVFVGIVAWTFLGERPRRRQLFGYGLIAAGLFALVYDYIRAQGRLDISGAAALVMAAVMWALYTLAAASSRPYVASGRGPDLLLVRHPLSAALFRTRPFEPDACVRWRTAVSVYLSRHHDERGSAASRSTAPWSCSARERQLRSLHLCRSPQLFSRYRFSANGPHGPPAAAICVIALGVAMAAGSANQDNSMEKADDPLLLPPDAQSGKSRADARGDRLSLSIGAGRYQQRRTAQARIPRHQSERQGACHRRHGGPRRKRSSGLRFQCDSALPGDKTGRLIGSPADRPELLSWLFFIATGIGPFSGQAVHFQHAAPEKLAYAINRYRREVERHYEVLDTHLKGREFIVGKDFTIADISAWGWLERAPRVLPGDGAASRGFPRYRSLVSRDRRTAGGRQEPARSERITPSRRKWMTRRAARFSVQLSESRALTAVREILEHPTRERHMKLQGKQSLITGGSSGIGLCDRRGDAGERRNRRDYRPTAGCSAQRPPISFARRVARRIPRRRRQHGEWPRDHA